MKKEHFLLIGDVNILQSGADKVPLEISTIGGTTDKTVTKLFTEKLLRFDLQYKSIKWSSNFLDCCFATDDLTVQCTISPNILYNDNYHHPVHRTQSYEINCQCASSK